MQPASITIADLLRVLQVVKDFYYFFKGVMISDNIITNFYR